LGQDEALTISACSTTIQPPCQSEQAETKASFDFRSIAATHEALLFVSFEDMMAKSDWNHNCQLSHFVLKRRPRHFQVYFLIISYVASSAVTGSGVPTWSR